MLALFDIIGVVPLDGGAKLVFQLLGGVENCLGSVFLVSEGFAAHHTGGGVN